MTVTGHGAGHIDPVHEASAEQRTQGIGVIGKNNLSHLGLRVADRPRHLEVFRISHVSELGVSPAAADGILRNKYDWR
jgi:hypothetical protein